MAEIKMPDDLAQFPILVVRESSAAWQMFTDRGKSMKPGRVIPATDEEFESLKKDVIAITKAQDTT